MKNFLLSIKAMFDAKQARQEAGKLQNQLESLSEVKWSTERQNQVAKDFSKSVKQIGTETEKVTDKSNDFIKAMRRALIVAPVWMAIRTAMMEVINTIKEGIKHWIDFDRAMIKVESTLYKLPGITKSTIGDLEKRIIDFSKETGIAGDKLAESFYKFSTVGISAEESFQGMVAATKLAVTTGADADKIANSLAMAYRLLGETIDSTLTPQQKMEQTAGNIFKLFQVNAGEANEFAQSLDNFVSVANVANISLDETIVLLSALTTAGLRQGKAGTLLKSSILNLVKNLGTLSSQLHIAVGEGDSTFETLMRVLEALKQLQGTKGIPQETLKSLSEIFGGVRGSQAAAGLVSLLDEINSQIKDVGTNGAKNAKLMNDRFSDVKNTLSIQTDIFNQHKKLLGQMFVQGIVGGEDFEKSLKNINELMPKVAESAKFLGLELKLVFDMLSAGLIPIVFALTKKYELQTKEAEKQVNIFKDISKSLSKNATAQEMINTLVAVESNKLKLPLEYRKRLETLLKAAIQDQYALEIQTQKEAIVAKQIADERERTSTALDKISPTLDDNLAKELESLNYIMAENAGISELVIAHSKLDALLDKIVNNYNQLTDAEGKLLKPIDAANLKSLVLSKNFNKVAEILEPLKLKEEDINKLADGYIDISKAQVGLLEQILDHELQISQIRGSSEKDLLDAEIQMKKMLYGEDAISNSLEYKLKTEKAITSEKLKQNKASSEALNLLKITQQYGSGIANEISKWLAGLTEWNKLSGVAQQAADQFYKTQSDTAKAQEELGFAGVATPEEQKEIAGQQAAQEAIGEIEKQRDEMIKQMQYLFETGKMTFADLSKYVLGLRNGTVGLAEVPVSGIQGTQTQQAQETIQENQKALEIQNLIQGNLSIPILIKQGTTTQEILDKVNKAIKDALKNPESDTYKAVEDIVEEF